MLGQNPRMADAAEVGLLGPLAERSDLHQLFEDAQLPSVLFHTSEAEQRPFLPLALRTRAGPSGLEHEPLRFAAGRLLENHGVDGLLWVWSFAPERLPPATDLPRIVLGPSDMGPLLQQAGAAQRCVFLPVATPGLNAPGHLFRTDGVVVPLVAACDDGLPGVDRVAAGLLQRLEAA